MLSIHHVLNAIVPVYAININIFFRKLWRGHQSTVVSIKSNYMENFCFQCIGAYNTIKENNLFWSLLSQKLFWGSLSHCALCSVPSKYTYLGDFYVGESFHAWLSPCVVFLFLFNDLFSYLFPFTSLTKQN